MPTQKEVGTAMRHKVQRPNYTEAYLFLCLYSPKCSVFLFLFTQPQSETWLNWQGRTGTENSDLSIIVQSSINIDLSPSLFVGKYRPTQDSTFHVDPNLTYIASLSNFVNRKSWSETAYSISNDEALTKNPPELRARMWNGWCDLTWSTCCHSRPLSCFPASLLPLFPSCFFSASPPCSHYCSLPIGII